MCEDAFQSIDNFLLLSLINSKRPFRNLQSLKQFCIYVNRMGLNGNQFNSFHNGLRKEIIDITYDHHRFIL